MAAKVYKNKNKIQKFFIFLFCFLGSSYLICMGIPTTSLYLTNSWPIYHLNEYLGYINFYSFTMHLYGVLDLIIIGYCYNMHIMIINMKFLLEWSHIMIECELRDAISNIWKLEMRHLLLAPTLNMKMSKWKVQPSVALEILIQTTCFSLKITIRTTSYSENSEGLCGIMGGSITYQIFNRIKVLKPCWYGCCFQSYETIYDITE